MMESSIFIPKSRLFVVVTILFVCITWWRLYDSSQRRFDAIRCMMGEREMGWLHKDTGNRELIPSCTEDKSKPKVFAAILSDNNYLGAMLCLINSLKAVHTRYPFVVFHTSGVGPDALAKLNAVPDVTVRQIPKFELYNRKQRFARSWTKLGLWNLTEYSRIVYLDADMYVMRNIDDLMDYPLPAGFAISPDVGMLETHFSSLGYSQAGFFVMTPCPATARHMLTLINDDPSLAFPNLFAEQDFFDFYFHFVRILLPPIYNHVITKCSDFDTLPPITREAARILHFATGDKPFVKPWKCWTPYPKCLRDVGLSTIEPENDEA